MGIGINGAVLGIKKLKDTINVLITDSKPPCPPHTTCNWEPTVLDTIKFIQQKNNQ